MTTVSYKRKPYIESTIASFVSRLGIPPPALTAGTEPSFRLPVRMEHVESILPHGNWAPGYQCFGLDDDLEGLWLQLRSLLCI